MVLQSLPVDQHRSEFISALEKHKFVCVIGSTGCGKSTRIPAFCVNWLRNRNEKRYVVCTMPRRIAATTVASRVRHEIGMQRTVEFGNALNVGYSVRFDSRGMKNAELFYCTDGILLNMIREDYYLGKFAVVIVDEIHERSINSDLLIALLKYISTKCAHLKVVFMSATMDFDRFRQYLTSGCGVGRNDCKDVRIECRTNSIQQLYLSAPVEDALEAAATAIIQIHVEKQYGDILVFVEGEEEIEKVCDKVKERLRELKRDDLVCRPLYGALTTDQQAKAFERYPNQRKCVIATNIAESSITIDGIVYVVDSGLAKHLKYDTKKGITSLITGTISKASAKQRAERAGRTQDGVCYRLYSELAFANQMLEHTPPEILWSDLTSMVLKMKSIPSISEHLGDLRFRDQPPKAAIGSALKNLYFLGAIDERVSLTQVGNHMANLPVDPQMARALIASKDYDCIEEMLSIAAIMSTQQPCIIRPKKIDRSRFMKAMEQFANYHGDHITMMNVYNKFMSLNTSEEERKKWCNQNFVRFDALNEATLIRKQLSDKIKGAMRRNMMQFANPNSPEYFKNIKQSLLHGYFMQIAQRDGERGRLFKPIVDRDMSITFDKFTFVHPESTLVIYHQLVETKNAVTMRTVTWIDKKWLKTLPNADKCFEL